MIHNYFSLIVNYMIIKNLIKKYIKLNYFLIIVNFNTSIVYTLYVHFSIKKIQEISISI